MGGRRDRDVRPWLVPPDDAAHRGVAAVKARRLTAGEGEFLGLDHAEALLRMQRGKAVLEQTIGRAAAGFIAPAWLYSDGARAALTDARFALAEDHARVWVPGGSVVARGPVVTWASRSDARAFASQAAAAVLRHTLHALPVVRVAVHPGDVTRPALLRSIDRTFVAFTTRGRRPGAYADLLSEPRASITI